MVTSEVYFLNVCSWWRSRSKFVFFLVIVHREEVDGIILSQLRLIGTNIDEDVSSIRGISILLRYY